MSTHTATLMARYQLPSQLPASLVWPYDRSGREMVPVAVGPSVAAELTRNLRAPYRAVVLGAT